MLVPESMQRLLEYQDAVNSRLSELLPPSEETSLDRAVTEAMGFGGKRIRATLALLWCEVYSGDYRPAIPLAVAYEFAHASALVQDDIIDRSNWRRGRKSVVAEYGLANAILASDLLLFNVPKVVSEYATLDSSKLARIFDMLGEACRDSTRGEYLDLEMARNDSWSEEEYERMVKMKTSTLLTAPCAGGALVGGASDEGIDLAGRFGEALGVAYQVQDDALDLTGSEADLGKPIFTDLKGGKKTLVLIHCARRSSGPDREFIASLMNRDGPYSESEVSRLRALLAVNGSIDYAADLVARRTEEAKAFLALAPESRAKSILLELTDYLATRSS